MNDVVLYAIALRLVSLWDTLFSQDDVFLESTPYEGPGTFATEVPSGRQVCNQPDNDIEQ